MSAFDTDSRCIPPCNKSQAPLCTYDNNTQPSFVVRIYESLIPWALQSRVGPVEWLQPYTDTTIEMLGEQGVKDLLAVPVSFVSEHIETLEEIDMEYRELAEESGIANWGRVPALNVNPIFINVSSESDQSCLTPIDRILNSCHHLHNNHSLFVLHHDDM